MITTIYGTGAALMFFFSLGYSISKTPESNFFAMLLVSAIAATVWPAVLIAGLLDRSEK